jgi:hypothetical protein
LITPDFALDRQKPPVRPIDWSMGLLRLWFDLISEFEVEKMAKPSHKVKKANHGKRPANNRGRKAKNKKIKTP